MHIAIKLFLLIHEQVIHASVECIGVIFSGFERRSDATAVYMKHCAFNIVLVFETFSNSERETTKTASLTLIWKYFFFNIEADVNETLKLQISNSFYEFTLVNYIRRDLQRQHHCLAIILKQSTRMSNFCTNKLNIQIDFYL